MAAPEVFDLAAFLQRIGLDDEPHLPPDLETLARIVSATLRTVPFENLDVALGRGVDLGSTFAKVVAHRRGGYCFELNSLMRAALSALGFQTRRVLCRVLLGPEPSPFTHLVTVVSLDSEDYLVDVGFGSPSPRRPLPLSSLRGGCEACLPGRHGSLRVGAPLLAYPDAFRFVEDCGQYVVSGGLRLQCLQSKAWAETGMPDLSQVTEISQGCWKDQYVFHPDAPVLDGDVHIGNWSQSSMMPGNMWLTFRVAVLLTESGRKFLRDGKLVRESRASNTDLETLFPVGELPAGIGGRREDGPVSREEEEVPDERWLETLREEFGLDLGWDHRRGEAVPLRGVGDFLPSARG